MCGTDLYNNDLYLWPDNLVCISKSQHLHHNRYHQLYYSHRADGKQSLSTWGPNSSVFQLWLKRDSDLCPVHLPGQNIFCPGQNQICPRQINFVHDKIFFVRDKNFVHGFKQVSSKQKWFLSCGQNFCHGQKIFCHWQNYFV